MSDDAEYWRRRSLEFRDAAARARDFADRLNGRLNGPPIRWHGALDLAAPPPRPSSPIEGTRAMRRHRIWDIIHEQSSLSALSMAGMFIALACLVICDIYAQRYGIDLVALLQHTGGVVLAFGSLFGGATVLYANLMKVIRPEAPVVVKAPETATVTHVDVTTEPTALANPAAPPG